MKPIAELITDALRALVRAQEAYLREYIKSLGVECDGEPAAIMAEVQSRVASKYGPKWRLIVCTNLCANSSGLYVWNDDPATLPISVGPTFELLKVETPELVN